MKSKNIEAEFSRLYNEYVRLHIEVYGDYGPSITSASLEHKLPDCNCVRCKIKNLKKMII